MSEIKHVSDTAIWVAMYRAKESERPDALFKDPLASKLAGEKGERIEKSVPYLKMMSWILVVRTVAIDKLIMKAIENGVDTVLNLGAGLDTRPYRMALPPSLKWIEVDYPHMIEYKNETLYKESPVCRLERISCDLSDENARRDLFLKIGKDSKSVLVITEGVIPYLTREHAAALSHDLLAVPTFKYWIQDYRNGGLKQYSPRKMRAILKDAPMKFDVVDWVGYFCDHGWKIADQILAHDEATRIKRPFPFMFPWSLIGYVLPAKFKEVFRKASGYVMYERGV